MPVTQVDSVPAARRASKVDKISELAEVRKMLEKPLTKPLLITLSPESQKVFKTQALAITSLVMKLRSEFKNVKVQVRNGSEIYLSKLDPKK